MLDRFAASLDQYRRSLWLSFVVLLGLQLGCQGDPYYSQYTRREPSRPDLVGWYEVTKESRDFIHRKVGDSQFLVVTLTEDGAFTIDGMPDIWRDDFGHSSGRFESMKGKWNPRRVKDGRWMIDLEVSRVSSTTGNQSDKRFVMPVALIGDHAPYLLHFTVGDPDQGEAIQCVSKPWPVLYSKSR